MCKHSGRVSSGLELLTVAEMAAADAMAVAAGVPSLTLMENAGRAVAEVAAGMVAAGAHVAVVCGPGNNGGDGFVAARLLAARGFAVEVACLVDPSVLKGDAAAMAKRWDGPILFEHWSRIFQGTTPRLYIDALFGAGLSRPLEGDFAAAVEMINQRAGAAAVQVLAVDVPSGLNGDSGAALGAYVVRATRTVTFFRRKPGHVLMPGRALCGEVVLADIGIPDGVFDPDSEEFGDAFDALSPKTAANAPGLWLSQFPRLDAMSHKYTRGHAIVVSGAAEHTGAARLGARGALRVGAGVVTVASPKAAVATNAALLTAIMVRGFDGPRGLADILSDERKNAVLIGPGCGVNIATRLLVQVALEFEASVVLDADALTSFTLDQDDDEEPVVNHLFGLIKEEPKRQVVLTPHEGEFKRVFADLTGSKLERARAAAVRAGAVVVLKGADTVIASPDGRAAINENAQSWLATAGSGDVLAGFVTGLLAQGMPAFEAACAAVWLHGECGNRSGRGLIAEDLPEMLPEVFVGLVA